MKILVQVLLLWCLALSAAAQPTTPMTLIRDRLQTDSGEVYSVPPEPSNLDPVWWRYFDVPPEQLEERVQTVVARLAALAGELPPEIAAAAAPHVELVRANLQALPQARAQPSAEPPAPAAYAESYSLAQVLELARQKREVEGSLGPERIEVDESERTLRANSRRIDTHMAAYLAMDASDPNRVLRALEIMAERTSLAVAEERLRLRRAELRANEVRAERLTAELEVASNRLQVQPEVLEELTASIEEARRILAEAQDRTVREQAQALTVVGDTPEDRAATRYREQRVLRAQVAEAIAEVRLIRLEAQQDLAGLLLGRDPPQAGILRTHIVSWSSRLNELRGRAQTWIIESERERVRTGEAVAAGETVTGVEPGPEIEQPVFIQLINQDRFNLAQETLVAARRLQDDIGQAELLLRLLDEQLLLTEGRLRDWLARGEQVLASAWQLVKGLATASLFKVGDTPVTALGLLRIVLIITAAWWISYWLRRGLIQLGERGEGVNMPAFYTISRLSHYVIIVIGFIVGLSSVGVDFTNFALVAGAVAIGIGFGLQSIVNNFVSGLILLFERSLKVGDFVELADGLQGEVREINVRSTLINTNDNIDIVVPNSEFMNTKVINWTLLEAYRRIHLPFRVAFGTDKELVRQAVLEAADKLPHTMTGIPGKNPAVWLVQFGDNGYHFELVVWLTPRAVKRPQAVYAAYMWEIDSALKKYDIKVPFPQRDLHLRTGFPMEWSGQERTQEAVVLPGEPERPAAARSGPAIVRSGPT